MRDDAVVEDVSFVVEADSALDGAVWKGPGGQKNHDMTANQSIQDARMRHVFVEARVTCRVLTIRTCNGTKAKQEAGCCDGPSRARLECPSRARLE